MFSILLTEMEKIRWEQLTNVDDNEMKMELRSLMWDLYWCVKYESLRDEKKKKKQVKLEVKAVLGRWEGRLLKFYMNHRKMKARSSKAFNYGVTSELQEKWTSVCMAGYSDQSLQCALPSSAKILAWPLANYITFSVLPNETKLYLILH